LNQYLDLPKTTSYKTLPGNTRNKLNLLHFITTAINQSLYVTALVSTSAATSPLAEKLALTVEIAI